MKRFTNRLTAVLIAGAVLVSAAGVNAAEYCGADTEISQNEIVPEASLPEEVTEITEITTECLSRGETHTEEETESAEARSETTTETITIQEQEDSETKEAETEATTEETISDSEGSGDTNIDITNTNIVNVENNTGDVYINIYNNIGVSAEGSGGGADVNIESYKQVAVLGEDSREETAAEAETETTTAKSKSSSSGGSSSRRSSVSTGGNSFDAGVYSSEAQEAESAKTAEKRAVCMTIGSSMLNIDGKIKETDSAPYISAGCTLAPLRCISAVFDADVQWNAAAKTAVIKTDDTEAEFTIGSDTMTVNGEVKGITKSAEISGGRTYVPLRALGEALGANVSWVPDSKTILIIKQ
ncbi:MAG: copper amine oxidase N-terminal domain-containing protein [Clostridiales bacterium]|nr:copper amine oxidase N-terminal domain-containing protein [Clostridiales bacterium]